MRLWTISNNIEINAVTRLNYTETIHLNILAKCDCDECDCFGENEEETSIEI